MKHDVPAREWFYDLSTRPNIRISQLGTFASNIKIILFQEKFRHDK